MPIVAGLVTGRYAFVDEEAQPNLTLYCMCCERDTGFLTKYESGTIDFIEIRVDKIVGRMTSLLNEVDHLQQ